MASIRESLGPSSDRFSSAEMQFFECERGYSVQTNLSGTWICLMMLLSGMIIVGAQMAHTRKYPE